LENEFNQVQGDNFKKAMLPKAPVAVNESWTFDPKSLGGAIAKEDQVIKTQCKAKLTKVYTKDGRMYGVIDADVYVHYKSFKKGDMPGGLATETKNVFTLKFDGCIDGALAEAKLTATGETHTTASYRTPELGAVTTVATASIALDSISQELPKK
jgi:hypothetical protein